jgi:nucleoid-associated protein YgaU
MPNDAKLGLVVGVGLVIALAVFFFRKETPTAEPAATIVKPSASALTPVPAPSNHRAATAAQASREVRRHVIAEGDTLFNLAQRYYGDGERFIDVYRANRDVLTSPDRLPVGTALIIPEGMRKSEAERP